MPTNRTPINRGSNVQITEEVVRLFVFCSEAEEEGTADTPEYFKALRAYHHLIRFRPWEFDPLQIVTEEPPAAVLRDRPDRLAEWRKARALRTKIENVAVELGI